MKTCIRCGLNKELSFFHKHKGMKDGHLNKCSNCVVECVDEWRKNNIDCRKKEHIKKIEKYGLRTRQEYFNDRLKNQIGRKASAKKYAHKRRLQVSNTLNEFDTFVWQEAHLLSELRSSIIGGDWHIDHIVPINHREACGLHNGFNLQVVPAVWNMQKGNRNMNKWMGQ